MPPEPPDDDILNLFDGICYRLDLEGNILAVGPGNWDRFVELTGDTGPQAQQVKQQNIFDFIAGDEVRSELRRVMDELISGDAADWVMPYRCDAPDTKRNMRMSIRPIRKTGTVVGFLFQSVLLDETQRPPLDIFDFSKVEAALEQVRKLPLVSMCSYCQKVKDKHHTGGQWVEAERYYAEGGSADVRLSHGICPDCKKVVWTSFRC